MGLLDYLESSDDEVPTTQEEKEQTKDDKTHDSESNTDDNFEGGDEVGDDAVEVCTTLDVRNDVDYRATPSFGIKRFNGRREGQRPEHSVTVTKRRCERNQEGDGSSSSPEQSREQEYTRWDTPNNGRNEERNIVTSGSDERRYASGEVSSGGGTLFRSASSVHSNTLGEGFASMNSEQSVCRSGGCGVVDYACRKLSFNGSTNSDYGSKGGKNDEGNVGKENYARRFKNDKSMPTSSHASKQDNGAMLKSPPEGKGDINNTNGNDANRSRTHPPMLKRTTHAGQKFFSEGGHDEFDDDIIDEYIQQYPSQESKKQKAGPDSKNWKGNRSDNSTKKSDESSTDSQNSEGGTDSPHTLSNYQHRIAGMPQGCGGCPHGIKVGDYIKKLREHVIIQKAYRGWLHCDCENPRGFSSFNRTRQATEQEVQQASTPRSGEQQEQGNVGGQAEPANSGVATDTSTTPRGLNRINWSPEQLQRAEMSKQRAMERKKAREKRQNKQTNQVDNAQTGRNNSLPTLSGNRNGAPQRRTPGEGMQPVRLFEPTGYRTAWPNVGGATNTEQNGMERIEIGVESAQNRGTRTERNGMERDGSGVETAQSRVYSQGNQRAATFRSYNAPNVSMRDNGTGVTEVNTGLGADTNTRSGYEGRDGTSHGTSSRARQVSKKGSRSNETEERECDALNLNRGTLANEGRSAARGPTTHEPMGSFNETEDTDNHSTTSNDSYSDDSFIAGEDEDDGAQPDQEEILSSGEWSAESSTSSSGSSEEDDYEEESKDMEEVIDEGYGIANSSGVSIVGGLRRSARIVSAITQPRYMETTREDEDEEFSDDYGDDEYDDDAFGDDEDSNTGVHSGRQGQENESYLDQDQQGERGASNNMGEEETNNRRQIGETNRGGTSGTARQGELRDIGVDQEESTLQQRTVNILNLSRNSGPGDEVRRNHDGDRSGGSHSPLRGGQSGGGETCTIQTKIPQTFAFHLQRE